MKRAQEEIVGFAVIMIIVAVILIIFLGLYLKKPTSGTTDDFVLGNFVEVLSNYNTDCETNRYIRAPIKDVVSECRDNKKCLDGRNSCDVLEATTKEILGKTWPVGPDWPHKGYEIQIEDDGVIILEFEEGAKTGNYRAYKGIVGINLKIYN